MNTLSELSACACTGRGSDDDLQTPGQTAQLIPSGVPFGFAQMAGGPPPASTST
jgi:hypothetical protein